MVVRHINIECSLLLYYVCLSSAFYQYSLLFNNIYTIFDFYSSLQILIISLFRAIYIAALVILFIYFIDYK